MIVLEYERKCTEEQVQDTQQNRRQYAKIKALADAVSPPITQQQGFGPRTIGSKKSSWNGLIQDHKTVFVIDLDMRSIGAQCDGFPVSFRSRIALLRSRTGWYVSGTNRTIKASLRGWG